MAAEYHDTMPREAGRILDYLRRRKKKVIPNGFTWIFVVSVDLTMAFIGAVAVFQRPMSDWPVAIAAMAAAISPWIVFVFFDISGFIGAALWSAWMVATAMLLFGTSTPVHTDFAPLLLALMVGTVSSLTSFRGGILAAVSAAALLCLAAALHRLDSVALYVTFVVIGALVGYLMLTQQRLLVEQREAHEQLAEHAAADERRRIAREVHDVIAHSLSVTLLHVTAARRALQQDRDVDDAQDALQDAERLGRQAMADIRRTVGLLDDGHARMAPEPDVDDIAALVDDFTKAGLAVRLRIDGPTQRVSATEGLALYRITQESLANIAKHAPDSQPVVTLRITRSAAELSVTNRLPVRVGAVGSPAGRGLPGMRQRVELLGGSIDIGPTQGNWQVNASIPLIDNGFGGSGGVPRVPWCNS